MTDFLGNFFIANIFDDNGELIESKHIKWTFSRPKIKTFSWNEGEYIVPDTSYMFKHSPFPWLFNYWFCSYRNNDPNPIKQIPTFQPPIPAKTIFQILKNNELKKLLNARNDWREFINLKNGIIALILIVGGMWWFNGGSAVVG